jgi:hypothetical protein
MNLKLNYNESLMDEKTYRKHDAWAASDLRLLAKGYGFYSHKRDYPEEYGYTAALRAGTITHTAVLEPSKFQNEYVVPPEINKRTKAGKEEWAAWEEENGDKFAITSDELHKANLLRQHVFANPKAAEMLVGGMAEVPLTWVEQAEDGELYNFKGRADYIKTFNDTMLVIDLKTTQDASYKSFQRSVVNWDYSLQAAHYQRGVEILHPDYDVHFVWVVIEKQAPYGCAIYTCTSEIYEHGNSLKAEGLKNLSEGSKGDPKIHSLPYGTDAKPMKLPAWARRRN